ncbi:MAG: acyltransferase family protein [Bacteroidota bacterium]
MKRGLQLLFIGYLLRLNLFGLLKGEVYPGFFLVDVLHCIGLSLILLIGLYLLTAKANRRVFSILLVTITIVLFLWEPWYKNWSFSWMPTAMANYFTKAHGSVFTIIPWLGYTTFGAFLSLLFTKYRQSKYLYPIAISLSLIVGCYLIFLASPLFDALYQLSDFSLFLDIQANNYLFIRLGNVLVIMAIFMLFRALLQHTTLLRIGSSTLSIYIVHFIVLYGSFTGLGLYKFFHHSLNPWITVIGAALFMVVCTFLALRYEELKAPFKLKIGATVRYIQLQLRWTTRKTLQLVREQLLPKLRLFLFRLFASSRN